MTERYFRFSHPTEWKNSPGAMFLQTRRKNYEIVLNVNGDVRFVWVLVHGTGGRTVFYDAERASPKDFRHVPGQVFDMHPSIKSVSQSELQDLMMEAFAAFVNDQIDSRLTGEEQRETAE